MKDYLERMSRYRASEHLETESANGKADTPAQTESTVESRPTKISQARPAPDTSTPAPASVPQIPSTPMQAAGEDQQLPKSSKKKKSPTKEKSIGDKEKPSEDRDVDIDTEKEKRRRKKKRMD
jgi:hypothetical protein